MASEQELNKTNPLHKEFQSLLDADFKDRKVKEGEIIKAVKNVKEITFNPILHNQRKNEIFIITERCIFNVEDGKIILIDVFPGIDIKNDILNNMDFMPVISKSLNV